MFYHGSLCLSLVVLVALPAHSAETTNYTYDAKGRLIKVVRAGTGATPVNVNIRVDYVHDRSNNRKAVNVTR